MKIEWMALRFPICVPTNFGFLDFLNGDICISHTCLLYSLVMLPQAYHRRKYRFRT